MRRLIFFLIIITLKENISFASMQNKILVNVGNQIITSGGMLAKIVKIDDENFITISISEGVNVKVKRDTITELIINTPISK